MTTVDRLLKVLNGRGLVVKPGKTPDQLLLTGPDHEKTAEVIEAVKAFKPMLLEWIQQAPREPETEAERKG